MTRCKVTCAGVTKSLGNPGPNGPRFLYSAKFYFVTSGSEENKRFFEYTPSGQLEISVYKEDVFQPGKSYYLDLTETE